MHMRLAGLVLLTTLLLTAVSPNSRGAELDPLPPSLKAVPDTAAFYSAMLRNGEQWENLLKSRAWAHLLSLPAVKEAQAKGLEQLKTNPEFKTFHKLLEQPENKELATLLGGLINVEAFVAGGSNFEDFVELSTILNGAQTFGPLALLAEGKVGMDFNRLRAMAVLKALADNSDKLLFPDLVFGFHTPDPKSADSQLKRLETFLQGFLDHAKLPIKPKFERLTLGNGKFLSLLVDGKQIPWSEIPWDNLQLEKEEIDKLIARLEKLKLSVRLGVSGNYVLLAIGGESKEFLEAIATGPKKPLASRAELAPIARYADRKLISVSYASKSLRTRGQTSPKDLEGITDMLKGLLENAPLDDKHKKKILKDVSDYIAEQKKWLPEYGASLSFAFLNDKGQEGYSIDYSKYPGQTRPAPLSLLNYLGGKPILAGVVGGQSNVDAYNELVKVINVIYSNLDAIAEDKLDGEPKEIYAKVKETALPLLKRLDTITRTLYLASLDGQMGLVIDGQWKSKNWLASVPQPDVALPLPEVALVLGLKDPEKFVKAFTEYRKLVQDTIDVIREKVPMGDNIPEIKLPGPKTVKKARGTLYFYPLPEEIGLDPQVVPTAGVGEKVAVLTMSHAFAERVLTSKPLEGNDLTLDSKKPLLGASVFHWPAFIDLVQPWVEVGIKAAHRQGGGPGKGGPDLEAILSQVREVVLILKCFKGASSTTYTEGEKTVTHSIAVFRDLEK